MTENPMESDAFTLRSASSFDTETTKPESASTLDPASDHNAEKERQAVPPSNPIAGKTQDSNSANDAWVVYSALMRAVRDAPRLRDDPRWVAMKQEAFDAYSRAFGDA